LRGVLRLVEQRGVATGTPLYWRLLARQLGVAGRLHAGEYALTPGLTPADLLRKMAAGDVVQHHFTIVEGWTFKQLRLALAQDAALQQTLAAVDDREIMLRLGAPGALAEGWFLPESLNGGCRSSKEISAKTGRAASETPIPDADDIALVTTPPGERPLESNDRTPCYCAAADSGADASRSQRRADCARMRSKSSGNR